MTAKETGPGPTIVDPAEVEEFKGGPSPPREGPLRAGTRSGISLSVLTWIFMVLVLVVLVVTPLAWLLIGSFSAAESGWTIQNYITAVTDPRYSSAFWNSLRFSGGVGVLSLALATPAAWAVSRTDMPLRGTFRFLILASYVTPPFLGALAWIILAGPNAGVLNKFFVAVTGASQGPLNIYSMTGLIVVVALYQYPLCFILMTAALDGVPSDVEEAARILGADARRVAMSITVPLVLPAVLGAFMLAFLNSMSLFGSPKMLALPARFHVVTTQIYQLFQFPIRTELAAAISLLLLAVTAALIYIQRRILGRRGFALLTGKGGVKTPAKLGGLRWVFCAYCAFLVLLSVGMPYWVLVRSSVSKAWGAGFSLSNLTLDHYRFVLFDYSPTIRAIRNSFGLAGLAATAAAVLTAVAAYVAVRKLTRGARVLPLLAMTPLVFPGIVMAVGLFAAYTGPPLVLYGSIWLLLVAYTTKFLPLAYVNSNSALSAVHVEMEHASRILGASSIRSFRDITLPLIKRGVMAAWIIVFMVSLRELSASVLLQAPGSEVLATSILGLQQEGEWESAAVLGVVLLAITFAILGIAFKLIGRNFLDPGKVD